MPAFLILAIASMGAAFAVRAHLRHDDRLGQSVFTRTLVLLIALGFAAGGVWGIVDLAREPLGHSGSTRAYVLFGMLVAGGLAYAIGTVVWTGSTAYALRVAGWLAVSLLLAFSWVLALAFPLAAVLIVALAEIPAARAQHVSLRTR